MSATAEEAVKALEAIGSYHGLDRKRDKRLLLFCKETGRPLAACINQDALDAASRLIGGQC